MNKSLGYLQRDTPCPFGESECWCVTTAFK